MVESNKYPIYEGSRAGFALADAETSVDIISVIKQFLPNLRPSEKRVADSILSDVNFSVHASNGELARKAGVSEPTVTRFSHSVGCAGVRELKVKLAQSLVVGRYYLEEPPHIGEAQTKPSLWQSVFEDIHLAINTAERQLRDDDIERGAAMIGSCHQLVTFGVGGGSTVAAQEAQHRFFRLGIAVSNYSDAQLMRMVAATLGSDDVILAISTTGKSARVNEAVTTAKQYGARVIAITKPQSQLSALADVLLQLYVPETGDALKPTASRYAFLAAIDMLAASTAYRKPHETQEILRRIKYAIVKSGDGEIDEPLGD